MAMATEHLTIASIIRHPCKRSPASLVDNSRRSRPHAASLRVKAQPEPSGAQQQLDLSVLRFTFGIPGFDESYLPRWTGIAFGSLILANHFLSPSSPTPAQLRTEALGICLAAFSTVLPYLGKFLKGANPNDRSSLPEGNNQIFALSQDLSAKQEEDLAWASYVLLCNTNTMSVAIAVRDALCVRGYWNTPDDLSKAQIVEWFRSEILQVGILDLTDTLYFPQIPDARLQGMLPKGVFSLLIQPLCGDSDPVGNATTNIEGFVLLASSAKYAYSDRDRAWAKAIANKFQGNNYTYQISRHVNLPVTYSMRTCFECLSRFHA